MSSDLVPNIRYDGILMPKHDALGRMYREVRCDNCHAFICDEYIRDGRIRFKCPRCKRIIIMEFRPPQRKPKTPAKQ